MANIMSMKKVFNKTSRNGFDLSRKNIFSAKVGELLPVSCIECLPGDSFNVKTKSYTRTMPINTAAYTRIREYYDWFFVPTNLLWNKFNTFVTQMGNNKQHATSISSAEVVGSQHPYFTTNQIQSLLNVMHEKDRKNQFGFNAASCSAKLLEYLDYGHWLEQDGSIKGQPQNNTLNPFPLLAYNKIYADYYRDSQWENADPTTFNINYMSGNTTSSMQLPISSLQNSENLGMFNLKYCRWNKDYFMGLMPNAQYGSPASISMSADGTLDLSLGTTSLYNSAFYTSNNDGSLVENQNIKVGSLEGNIDRLRYVTTDSGFININFTPQQLLQLRNSLGLTSTSASGSASLDTTFTILALRNAEAQQKWAEITQSHSQDYASQIDAHFGVKVSDAYSERSTYIAGQVGTIDISAIENTNLQNNAQADIAGKGVGASEDFFKFETKVHGYLMCIYHAVPMLDYAISGIPKHNLKTMVTDYAIPEFDRTGMVNVPWVELSSQYGTPTKLLGYAPRYYDYKTSYDLVHGSPVNGGLDAWVAPVSDEYINTINAQYSGNLNYAFFKVNPATLNPIFAFDADSTTASDQLLVNSYYDIKAVRNLDVDGLPY